MYEQLCYYNMTSVLTNSKQKINVTLKVFLRINSN